VSAPSATAAANKNKSGTKIKLFFFVPSEVMCGPFPCHM
jgi:hypothetical protein